MMIKSGKKQPEPEVTVLRKGKKKPKTQELAEGTPRDVHAGHQRGDGKRILA